MFTGRNFSGGFQQRSGGPDLPGVHGERSVVGGTARYHVRRGAQELPRQVNRRCSDDFVFENLTRSLVGSSFLSLFLSLFLLFFLSHHFVLAFAPEQHEFEGKIMH